MRLFERARGTWLDTVPVGGNGPARIAGVINVSPESFYAGSIRTAAKSLAAQAEAMARQGADLLDVGAMSTAPYKETRISAAEEIRRLEAAIPIVRAASGLPVSVDTERAKAAAAALAAGATVVNAVGGLDTALAEVAKQAKGLIIMAREQPGAPADPLGQVRWSWQQSLRISQQAGLDPARIVLDPGLGFFRNGPLPWYEWDCLVLRELERLAAAGYPLLVGVSRKSFIGELLGRPDPADRLAGSLAATTIAVLHGAALIRTHDVAATRDAVRLTEAIQAGR